MKLELWAEYNLKGDRVRGMVVKANRKTVVVRTPDGHNITRHFARHKVRYLPHETY